MMASVENRLASIDTRLSALTWMAGTNLVLNRGRPVAPAGTHINRRSALL
jgi:hypothetical protein